MHWVQVLIAPVQSLAELKHRFPGVVVCPLTQGLGLVPITERLASEVAATDLPAQDPPEQLAEEMEPGIPSLAASLSASSPVVYAATYFFGGAGGQDALVWEAGKITLCLSDNEEHVAEWPNSSISRALRHIGVTTSPGEDEFDAVGLGKHRSNDAWARANEEA